MLSVGQLQEGVVLDHIPAGKAMDIYKRRKLDRLDCQVAMIMHAHSNKMGQKDINCKNPRCISTIEQGLDQVFYLADEEHEIYRCRYCDEQYHSSKKKGV